MTIFLNSTGNLIPFKFVLDPFVNNSIDYYEIGQTAVLTNSTNKSFTLSFKGTVGSTDAQYPTVDIISKSTSNALTTINPNSGTISGQSSLIIGANDCLRITEDGTNYFIERLFLQPANVSAYLNSNQTLPATGSTLQIPYSTKNFDVGGFFTTGASANYTPKLPGKYKVNIQAEVELTTLANTNVVLSLYMNGAEIYRNKVEVITGLTGVQVTLSVNPPLIPMNGSTDTLTAFLSQDSATAQTVIGTAAATFFGAERFSLF